MSRRLVFVTGGARSGKSGFAVTSAEMTGGKLIYLATATAGDPEMEERIERHRKLRGNEWETIEEPVDPAGVIAGIYDNRAALVLDCLTLWLTNLLVDAPEDFDGYAREKAAGLAEAFRKFPGTAFVVSNEVGMGIVPENALARRFRDAAGAVNRVMAAAADEAYLVVSGLPVKIK